MNNSKISNSTSPALRWLFLFLLLLTLLILPFVFFEEQIERFSARVIDAAPAAPQLAAVIGAALTFDVILPVPSSLVNAVAGATLAGTNPYRAIRHTILA